MSIGVGGCSQGGRVQGDLNNPFVPAIVLLFTSGLDDRKATQRKLNDSWERAQHQPDAPLTGHEAKVQAFANSKDICYGEFFTPLRRMGIIEKAFRKKYTAQEKNEKINSSTRSKDQFKYSRMVEPKITWFFNNYICIQAHHASQWKYQ